VKMKKVRASIIIQVD